MPYIDTTPIDTYLRIDEDNAIEQIGQLLVDNGWTFVKSFRKAVGDTRAFYRAGERRTAYAFAEHFIYRNAEGRLLGLANAGFHSVYFTTDYGEIIRRPNDDVTESDKNFGITPSWNEWARQKLADTVTNNKIYVYMLEKAPSDEMVPQDSLISCTVMPGMSKTRIDPERDRDLGYYDYERNWSSNSYQVKYREWDKDDQDLEFNGKLLSASEIYMIEAALDVEVHKTTWLDKEKEVMIDYAEPRIMQSPIVEIALRPGSVEYVNNPVYYTNWWTDSEIRLKGFIDSKTINVVIQADTAPLYNGNAVPNIPLYFGKIIPINGKELDEFEPGYALFGGAVPPDYSIEMSSKGTVITVDLGAENTVMYVKDPKALPPVGKDILIGSKEIAKIIAIDGYKIEVERRIGIKGAPGLEGDALEAELEAIKKDFKAGTRVKPTDETMADARETDVLTLISKFNFDDPDAKMDNPKMPILKTYNQYPSNGLDSVMCSKTRFGARYQKHYLSWGAAPNAIPPIRDNDGKKYDKSYDQMEKSENYKFQFNDSRYSGKVHASPVYIVHPEEGVRGQLEYAIGFNPQSISNSLLRVRTEECPDLTYNMYAPNVINAVSPLTKVPATTFRPMGYGIFKEHNNPFLNSYDPTTDKTLPNLVKVTRTDTSHERSVLVQWTPPTDPDFFGVNVYANGKLYAKNVSGINSYLLGGFSAKDEVIVEIESIDLAGNVSATKVVTEPVIIQ